MSALATLTTTTLAAAVSSSDSRVQLTSIAGVVPGIFLYCEQELMLVEGMSIGTEVLVQRGVEGTSGQAHSSLDPVTIGRGDQFYQTNPFGGAPAVQLVSPWINVLTGEQWTAQGDETGLTPNLYWARTQYARSIGAFGVRQSIPEVSATTLV
jgi:hypothetical protein